MWVPPLELASPGTSDLQLMNLDRSTAEKEMDEMVANSQLSKMLDSLTI